MTKNYVISFLVSLLVNSIAVLSGAINWYFQFGVTACVFFAAGLLSNKFQIKAYLYFLIVCFPFFFYTFYTIYNLLIYVFPISIIPYISFFISFTISKHKIIKKKKIQYFVLYLLFIISFSTLGMPNYLSYIFNYDSLEIEKEKPYIQDFSLYDSTLNKIELQKMKGKIIVLDFWTTSCGVCYKKFPEFEKLAGQYKEFNNVCFYAVNIITKRDSIEKVIKHTETLGYNFPFLFTKASDVKSIQKKTSVFSFPTIIIINNEGKIVYHGSLLTDDIILYHNTKRTIDKLLSK